MICTDSPFESSDTGLKYSMQSVYSMVQGVKSIKGKSTPDLKMLVIAGANDAVADPKYANRLIDDVAPISVDGALSRQTFIKIDGYGHEVLRELGWEKVVDRIAEFVR